MTARTSLTLILMLVFILVGCNPQAPATPTASPTIQVTYLPTVVTPTQAVTPTTEVPAETATPEVTAIPTGSGLPDISSTVYLDDRSTPAALMLSYFNAVNRHEYLRAYAYYGSPADLGTLDEFSAGYAETQSVSAVFGQISGEGAAGSLYYTVPMVLNATTTAGVAQKFAACYVLRLPQPGNYSAPPINPMHIVRGTAAVVSLTTSDADAMAGACPAPDYPTGPNASSAVVESLSDLSSGNYIDNRSDPTAVLSSYINAINRKEYVRAYSYWQTAPDSYDAFAAGYEGTAHVTAAFGTYTSDPGAGQIYYSLPIAMRATQGDGSVKTYAGCYALHISQPGIQGTLPFQPLGIISASVQTADNAADLGTLVPASCN